MLCSDILGRVRAMQPIAERQDLGPPSLWVFLTPSLDCTNTQHGVGLTWLIFIGLFGSPIPCHVAHVNYGDPSF